MLDTGLLSLNKTIEKSRAKHPTKVEQSRNIRLEIIIGSLMRQHKASNSFVFSDIKKRQNLAGH